MSGSSLTEDDYLRLLDIMRGPHGDMASADGTADLLIVFCSDDPSLARRAAALHATGRFDQAIFAGSSGKDSGELAQLGITEAAFQASVAMASGLPARSIHLEERSTNGAENAQFSLRLATATGLISASTRIASLAPAQRSRRLYEELRYQHTQLKTAGKVVGGFSVDSDRQFDTTIRAELAREASGLMTMHVGVNARIFPQPDFLDDQTYDGLMSRLSTLSAAGPL